MSYDFAPTSASKYPFALTTFASAEQIAERTTEAAAKIAHDYKNAVSTESPLLLVCVLKGAYMFTADLARALARAGVPTIVEFICVSSYAGTTQSSGEVRLLMDTRTSVQDRHVIFVEDILDTSRTLHFLIKLFSTRGAATVKTVVLLDKPEGRVMPFKADYVCFTIRNEFVIGYGLDYDEAYRELPDVVVLKPEVYTKKGETSPKKKAVIATNNATSKL